MSFGGSGSGSIKTSTDVALSNLQTNDLLSYDSSVGKWENKPAPASLQLQGDYADLTAYAVGDVVSYNGSSYAALVAIPNTNTTPPADGTTWQLMAAQGADGADSTVAGPAGANGVNMRVLRCPNPSQGTYSDYVPIGVHETLLGVTLGEDSPGPASSLVLQFYRNTGSGDQALYTTLANRPQLAANQTTSSSMPAPDVSDLPALTRLRAQIVTAPSGGGASPSPRTPVQAASSSGTQTSSAVPLVMPAGVAAGDLLVAVVIAMTTLDLPTPDGSGASNGWFVAKNAYTGASNPLTTLVIYKIATSSNDPFPSSFTFGTTSRYAWGVVAIQNVDSGTPLDPNSATSLNTSGTQAAPQYTSQYPIITPGSDGETLLYITGFRFNNAATDGIKPVGAGSPVTNLTALNGQSSNGSNLGISMGFEAAPAAGTASSPRSVGQIGDSTASNAPLAWSGTTAYSQGNSALDNDASGTPQVWKKYSSGSLTSTTHPKDDPTNWVRSGYDTDYAQVTLGIRGTVGGPGSNLVAYVWTQAV